MTAARVLAQAPGWRVLPVGDEVSLFDSASGQALRLNRTASDVYSLADGERTEDELVSALAEAYGLSPEDIAQDVAVGLDQLVDCGALRVSD
jgi:hypothetical protein